jgi:glucose 1-dehydrogenase
METRKSSYSPEPSLRDQVAIISGGLGDIGRATALELARRGAHVALSDIRPAEEAAPALDALAKLGAKPRYDRVDVSDAAAVSAWVSTVEAEMGLPSLIIVNAAQVTFAGFGKLTPAQWTRELRVNLDGAFHLAHAAAQRLLAASKPGRIVFLGSVAGHLPSPNTPAYCVAKAGLRMLCKCMAMDLAPHGILVNEIAPGYVDAGVSAEIWRKDPEFRDICRQHVPIGQLITPDEIAQHIAYLCEPANRHMTGSVLLVDGGVSFAGPQKPRQ